MPGRKQPWFSVVRQILTIQYSKHLSNKTLSRGLKRLHCPSIQTIFGKISVIVTLGRGGGGGKGGRGGYDAKKSFIVSKYCFYNTEHPASCSVDSSGSSYVYSDYTAH